MKRYSLFFLMLCIPCYVFAQKSRTEKATNLYGDVFSITTYTKIDKNTETVKTVDYAPSKKPTIITGITTYTLIDGKKEGRYENRNFLNKTSYVKWYYTYSNGKLHGKAAYYHDDKKLYYEEYYVDGKKEGEVIYYHYDGTIRSKGEYKNDEKEGEWIYYHWGTKKVNTRGHYKNGKRNGIWKSYFEDGKMEPEKKYVNGELDENHISTEINTFINPWRTLRGICGYIGSDIEDSNPQGKYKYTYQIKILSAANVDINKDSQEDIARKVSQLWEEYEDKLICNNTQFDVVNGNIIKFAVSQLDDRFIFDMIDWKVNLNKVDEWDGRTVLDYVKYQWDKGKGTSLERTFRLYYDALKRAGAKHKDEL